MQLETIDEAIFVRSLKMVKGKCVYKESNTLVVSFLEMSGTRSEAAVADKNAIRLSLYTRIKTVCHRT